jgi:hypothetical protein
MTTSCRRSAANDGNRATIGLARGADAPINLYAASGAAAGVAALPPLVDSREEHQRGNAQDKNADQFQIAHG